MTNSFSAVTNAMNYTPATNSYGGITFALGYSAVAATYSAIIAALNFTPATNNPASSTIVYAQQVSGITNASGYVTNLMTTLNTNTIVYQHP